MANYQNKNDIVTTCDAKDFAEQNKCEYYRKATRGPRCMYLCKNNRCDYSKK